MKQDRYVCKQTRPITSHPTCVKAPSTAIPVLFVPHYVSLLDLASCFQRPRSYDGRSLMAKAKVQKSHIIPLLITSKKSSILIALFDIYKILT